ncbi:MAG: DUF4381 domain-containing protein [Luteolibacter sp.]
MSDDPTSLDRLHDLVAPPPAPWWPPTPGWSIVLAIAAIALLAWLLNAFIRWQANRYRREALALLDDPGTPPREWSAILKRAALVAWPRADVASLTGPEWLSFLDRTAGMTQFTAGAGRSLEAIAFGPSGTVDAAAVRQVTRLWITRHKKEVPQ